MIDTETFRILNWFNTQSTPLSWIMEKSLIYVVRGAAAATSRTPSHSSLLLQPVNPRTWALHWGWGTWLLLFCVQVQPVASQNVSESNNSCALTKCALQIWWSWESHIEIPLWSVLEWSQIVQSNNTFVNRYFVHHHSFWCEQGIVALSFDLIFQLVFVGWWIIFHYIQIYLYNFLGFEGFTWIFLFTPVLINLNLTFKPKELWNCSEHKGDMQVSCPALVLH